MLKKMTTLLLALVLALTAVAGPVLAAVADTAKPMDGEVGLDPIGEDGYITMATGDDAVALIKHFEGFVDHPMWDVSQYSIGYGSRCPDELLAQWQEDPENFVFTEEDGDALLRELLVTMEMVVNNFAKKNDIQFTQNQFDALVMFTYALGDSWARSDCRLSRWLKNPTTLEDLVYAFGVWCRVSSAVNSGTAQRRTIELDIFLYGLYHTDRYNGPTFVPVVYNGGTAGGSKVYLTDQYTDAVGYFRRNDACGALLTPQVEGYTFLGWCLDQVPDEDSQWLTEDTVITKTTVVYGQWEAEGDGETDPSEPTDPVEPTDPSEPTDPTDPSEPDVPEDFPFDDVPEDAWYYEPVCFAYFHNFMNGITEDTFEPKTTLTRGMAVTVLHRLAGKRPAEAEGPFTDVAPNRYYTNAIAWAVEHGICQGITETTFEPESPVTREQLVTFFYRYCKYLMMEDHEMGTPGDLSVFDDGDELHEYAKVPMAWAVGIGIVRGDDTNCLHSGDNATRAEFAAMFQRFLEHALPK